MQQVGLVNLYASFKHHKTEDSKTLVNDMIVVLQALLFHGICFRFLQFRAFLSMQKPNFATM
jgi:hypothetical protein